ncbi:transposase [Sorangium sp. So ce1078]|uniref:transposase n=1 Tax=Sorangium sp. So ce1078 TaxID=3133329 RepID=UPI003F5F54A4
MIPQCDLARYLMGRAAELGAGADGRCAPAAHCYVRPTGGRPVQELRRLVRNPARPASAHRPRSFVARRPNQVWCWDITYLKSAVRGAFYFLYLVVDVYSRKIVGWSVETEESMVAAARLVEQTRGHEKVGSGCLVLHADNGGPMKGSTMLATLQRLGVVPSFSRPRVSDDNPYAEALFRTLKYRPEYPRRPFATVEQARQWVARFVAWYNGEHLHSSIRFVTPDDRHRGRDGALLAARHAVYQRGPPQDAPALDRPDTQLDAHRPRDPQPPHSRGSGTHEDVTESTDNYLDAHRPRNLCMAMARGSATGRRHRCERSARHGGASDVPAANAARMPDVVSATAPVDPDPMGRESLRAREPGFFR